MDQTATGRHVLLVDDEADIRELCRINLELRGWTVSDVDAASGVRDAIDQQRPDVVVLDLRMPGGDGWSVLATLKSDEATADLPVVLLSADGRAVEVLGCWEPGLLELVEKPFLPATLLAAVDRAGATTVDPVDHASRVLSELRSG